MTDAAVNELVCSIIGLSGYFTQKGFFTNKLWKKDKACKHFSDGEVMAYFMAMTARDKGIYVRPLGATWASPCTKEQSDQYVEEMRVLSDCYWNWAKTQR